MKTLLETWNPSSVTHTQKNVLNLTIEESFHSDENKIANFSHKQGMLCVKGQPNCAKILSAKIAGNFFMRLQVIFYAVCFLKKLFISFPTMLMPFLSIFFCWNTPTNNRVRRSCLASLPPPPLALRQPTILYLCDFYDFTHVRCR